MTRVLIMMSSTQDVLMLGSPPAVSRASTRLVRLVGALVLLLAHVMQAALLMETVVMTF